MLRERVEQDPDRSAFATRRIKGSREIADFARLRRAQQRRIRRYLHCADALRMQRHLARCVATLQQRLAKTPEPNEVEILFARQRIESGKERACVRRNPGSAHRMQVGFREILEPETRRMRDEIAKIERVVRHGQVIVT